MNVNERSLRARGFKLALEAEAGFPYLVCTQYI